MPMHAAPAPAKPAVADTQKNKASGLPSARSKEELERLLTPQRTKPAVTAPPATVSKPAAEPAPPPVRRPAPPPPASNIPWNKIAPVAIIAVIVIGGLLFFRGGTPAKPASTDTPDAAGTSGGVQMEDVDVELGVREALAKTSLLRNEKIDYRVKDGTLTLIGEATSAAKVQEAMRQARLVPGVKNVVNKVSVRSGEEVESDTHVFKTGSLQPSNEQSSGPGVAQQAKAHDLVISAQKQMAKGDYKGAASLFRKALALNPDDSEAQAGYATATDKAQN
jgi:BON domain-containing protein/tetratricopeptide repeat protein